MVINSKPSVIASHSAGWRGNPFPVGDARDREKVFIYTHPPPFDAAFPDGKADSAIKASVCHRKEGKAPRGDPFSAGGVKV